MSAMRILVNLHELPVDNKERREGVTHQKLIVNSLLITALLLII